MLRRTAELPEPVKSAMFVYAPERLSEDERAELGKLYNGSEEFRQIVESLNRDRRWLAPQYGL